MVLAVEWKHSHSNALFQKKPKGSVKVKLVPIRGIPVMAQASSVIERISSRSRLESLVFPAALAIMIASLVIAVM